MLAHMIDGTGMKGRENLDVDGTDDEAGVAARKGAVVTATVNESGGLARSMARIEGPRLLHAGWTPLHHGMPRKTCMRRGAKVPVDTSHTAQALEAMIILQRMYSSHPKAQRIF